MMTTVGLLDGCQCRCEWEEDGTAKMTLISTDKCLAWYGVLGKDLLEDKGFRKKVAGEEDASDKDLLDALTSAFEGDMEKYTFSVDIEGCRLLWKKSSGKFKQKVAEINLVNGDYNASIDSLLNYLRLEKKQNTVSINDLRREKENTARILERYEKTLDIFEKEKNGLEDKLYSKFLPVLNAKKEEILRLQKLLNISRGTAEPEVDYGEDVDTDVDEDEDAGGWENKRQKL